MGNVKNYCLMGINLILYIFSIQFKKKESSCVEGECCVYHGIIMDVFRVVVYEGL